MSGRKAVKVKLEKGKKILKELLHKNIPARFLFEKKDGEMRIMEATLNPSKIPEELQPKGTGHPKANTIMSVFDTEKNEWRSFRWDALRTIDDRISNTYIFIDD